MCKLQNAVLTLDHTMVTEHGLSVKFVSVIEIKHKSSAITTNVVQNILASHLKNKKLKVLDLSNTEDCKLFRK